MSTWAEWEEIMKVGVGDLLVFDRQPGIVLKTGYRDDDDNPGSGLEIIFSSNGVAQKLYSSTSKERSPYYMVREGIIRINGKCLFLLHRDLDYYIEKKRCFIKKMKKNVDNGEVAS